MNIIDEIYALKDEKYAKFQSILVPNVDKNLIIGVRIPLLRKMSNRLSKDEISQFLQGLPHKFYDENILHSILISKINNFDICLENTDKFLPYIDNWAVCDIISPKIFAKNTAALLEYIQIWVRSKHEFTCRFGIKMLMQYFLGENFKAKFLQIPLCAGNNKYYVNMMIAWFYATALCKKWDEAYKFLQIAEFDKWIFNKIIQKANESRLITKDKCKLLKELKIKFNMIQ